MNNDPKPEEFHAFKMSVTERSYFETKLHPTPEEYKKIGDFIDIFEKVVIFRETVLINGNSLKPINIPVEELGSSEFAEVELVLTPIISAIRGIENAERLLAVLKSGEMEGLIRMNNNYGRTIKTFCEEDIEKLRDGAVGLIRMAKYIFDRTFDDYESRISKKK